MSSCVQSSFHVPPVFMNSKVYELFGKWKRTWLQIHHRASRAAQTQSLFFAYFLWKCHNPPTEAEIHPTQLSLSRQQQDPHVRLQSCCELVSYASLQPASLCRSCSGSEHWGNSSVATAVIPAPTFPCFRVLLASTNNQWVKTHPCGGGGRDT